MVTKDFEYKKAANVSLDNIPDMGYTEGKVYKEDIFYTTKEPNEVFVNFFGLKLRCEKYRLTFLSKSLLHKYFKPTYAKQD